MNFANSIDSLNRRTMGVVVDEYAAIVREGLNVQERAAIASVHARIKGGRILDLGVGAGRTVAGLHELSNQYLGVDYSREMVDHCRTQFPGTRFEHMDARSMPELADGPFDFVFFSCSRISMVDHAGRLAILSEVKRLLSPDGVFIFSTFNVNSAQYAARFLFPDFQSTRNPVELAVRAGRFVAQTIFRLFNRLRNLKYQTFSADYSIINDVYHHYRVMIYFIAVENQRQQFRQAGFDGASCAFDMAGKVVADSRDGTMVFVVAKSADGSKS